MFRPWTLSAASSAINDWLALSPFDWRGYFQRAELILSNTGDQEAATADFTRARFVEPILRRGQL